MSVLLGSVKVRHGASDCDEYREWTRPRLKWDLNERIIDG